MIAKTRDLAIAIPRNVRNAIGTALLGAALIFVAGFLHIEAAHDGAHDARHSAALPCH